ncbi:MAG: hypothetical protein ACYTF0_07320, partial [Planctomycetota bacterium]
MKYVTTTLLATCAWLAPAVEDAPWAPLPADTVAVASAVAGADLIDRFATTQLGSALLDEERQAALLALFNEAAEDDVSMAAALAVYGLTVADVKQAFSGPAGVAGVLAPVPDDDSATPGYAIAWLTPGPDLADKLEVVIDRLIAEAAVADDDALNISNEEIDGVLLRHIVTRRDEISYRWDDATQAPVKEVTPGQGQHLLLHRSAGRLSVAAGEENQLSAMKAGLVGFVNGSDNGLGAHLATIKDAQAAAIGGDGAEMIVSLAPVWAELARRAAAGDSQASRGSAMITGLGLDRLSLLRCGLGLDQSLLQLRVF